MRRTGVAVLGSTGSIGRSALNVLMRHTDRFRVVALAANTNADLLCEQTELHGAALAVLAGPNGAARRPRAARWLEGGDALLEAVAHPDVDIVINAVVGAAGLRATLATLEAGKRLALANKESLVAGGPLVIDAMRRGGGEMVPVDSEHSAILQCLRGAREGEVRRLILTASGGPFRERDRDSMQDVLPAEALRHPTWSMGAKITIDSATLANKALEVIEAHFLFGVPYGRIEVVIHPQSIIHSMVEFADGSIVAQLGYPSMELPILYALTHPARTADEACWFDPVRAGALTFEALEPGRFPTFDLGIRAGRIAGTMPAVFNAANEVAVAGFLAGELPFLAISEVIEATMAAHEALPAASLETVLQADAWARTRTRAAIEARC